ncbi:lytic transglycosylase domain-containing protein [Phenylobacterium koreense]|uniref:Transglycosylase SLT domain-containing protein n=1 Tax=Phenylobacterium koreense TaxID=266125 RepID=A0ABV2EM90_9CAUL
MVAARCLALLLALAGGPAAAQSDWSAAGGALFVGAEPNPVPVSDDDVSTEMRARPAHWPFAEAIGSAASRHGLDPKLLAAVVAVESAFQAEAVSKAGAGGLTQLMPATAEELGVTDRFDPQANLLGGADYLARQLARFGDLRLALAAYNAGPARVERLGRVPAIAETQAYVETVVECFLAISAGRQVKSAQDCRSQGGR